MLNFFFIIFYIKTINKNNKNNIIKIIITLKINKYIINK
jgi:hypothetical protein